MANEIVVQEKAKLPAHLAGLFEPVDNNDDLASGLSGGFGSLSIKGKEFSVSSGGERRTVMSVLDGEEVAARSVDVVLIKSTKAVSKTFYKGEYVEGSDVNPDCASSNGIKPDASIEKPVHSNCATCPMNAFGSHRTGKGKACSDSKRVAVALMSDLDKPLLLRLSYTSMKPLEEYGRMLAKRGVPYQAIETKLGFEQGVTHPQLTFKPARANPFLTAEQAAVVKGHMESSVVEDILGLHTPVHEGVPNGTAGGKEVQEAPKASEAPKTQAAPVPAKAPAPKPVTKPATKPEADAFIIDEPAPVKSAPAKAPATKIVEAADSKTDAALVDALSGFDL